MIRHSISLHGFSETYAESAQSITSVSSSHSTAGLRPNPGDIDSEVKTWEETTVH